MQMLLSFIYGLAKNFVQVFQKNPNILFGQPNMFSMYVRMSSIHNFRTLEVSDYVVFPPVPSPVNIQSQRCITIDQLGAELCPGWVSLSIVPVVDSCFQNVPQELSIDSLVGLWILSSGRLLAMHFRFSEYFMFSVQPIFLDFLSSYLYSLSPI